MEVNGFGLGYSLLGTKSKTHSQSKNGGVRLCLRLGITVMNTLTKKQVREERVYFA